jgi:hypothetical protein
MPTKLTQLSRNRGPVVLTKTFRCLTSDQAFESFKTKKSKPCASIALKLIAIGISVDITLGIVSHFRNVADMLGGKKLSFR